MAELGHEPGQSVSRIPTFTTRLNFLSAVKMGFPLSNRGKLEGQGANHLPAFTQLGNGRAGMWTQVIWLI